MFADSPHYLPGERQPTNVFYRNNVKKGKVLKTAHLLNWALTIPIHLENLGRPSW